MQIILFANTKKIVSVHATWSPCLFTWHFLCWRVPQGIFATAGDAFLLNTLFPWDSDFEASVIDDPTVLIVRFGDVEPYTCAVAVEVR